MLRRTGLLFATTVAGWWGGATGLAAQSVPLYLAQVQHHGREVEVRVNGVPVSSNTADMSTLAVQISPFLRDGTNTLELRWTRTAESPLQLSVEISKRTTAGTDPEEVATLGPIADDPANQTLSRTLTFDAAIPIQWSWEAAAPITDLTAADRTAVIGEVESIHRAFAEGDADGVIELLGTVLQEHGLMRDGVVDRTRSAFKRMMSASGWGVQPFDRGRLVVEPFGRMVRVGGPSPVIESNPLEDGGRVMLPSIYLAKLGGRWKAVRRGS